MAFMTKDKFRDMLDELLVPLLAKLIDPRLKEMEETLEVLAGGVARIEQGVDHVISIVSDDR